jgi:peptide/nickel transport system substrate-binding protein
VEKTLERLSERMPAWTGDWSKRRLAAAAVVVVLVVVVAVSCTGGSGGRADVPVLADGADAGIDGVRSPSDRAGGTLRVVSSPIDSLDPQRSYHPGVWNLMRLYTRTLVTYASEPGGTAELVPDLATDLGTVSDDGLTWTFTLKSGLMFEDRTPITSGAVKYGIERSFASDVIVGGPTHIVDLLDDPANPYAGPYLEAEEEQPDLTAIETPDDATIVFHLRRPAPEFPYVLALPSSSPVPAAQDTREKYGRDPVSSGPYLITSNDPNAGIVLDRNPNWSPETDEVRTALPDRVVVRHEMTALERDQALLAGSADVDISTHGVHAATTARLSDDVEDDGSLDARIDDLTTGTIRLLAMPTTVAPMDNPACRQAVTSVVDRAAVQEELGGAINAVHTSQLWPRGLPGAPEDLDPRPDLDAARAALAECGQPEGFETVMAVPDVRSSLDVAEVLAAQLAEVGIVVEIRPFPQETFYATDVGEPANVTASGFGLVLATWTADSPSPASFLAPLVDGRAIKRDVGNANHAQLNVPEINELVVQARAAGDTAEAGSLWRRVAAAAEETRTYVPLTETRVQLVAGQRLRNGLVMQPYSSYDLATAGVR